LRIVVADTGPINYLIAIGHIDILPILFGTVVLPSAVRRELSHPKAPLAVRTWSAAIPSWVEVWADIEPALTDDENSALGDGERAAIALAAKINADLLLMDDRAGVLAAESRRIKVAGTLGILVMASRRQLIDLDGAFESLRKTNFHCSRAIMDNLLRSAR